VSSLAQVPRSTVVAWLLIALVLAGGVYLRLAFREPKGRTPDEGFYTAYAIDASRGGPAAVRAVTRLFNESPKMRKYPRPTRVGYYLPSALLMRLTGERTVKTASLVSTAASLLALALCLGLAARRLGAWPALVALLFLAASPLDLTMARKAWVDALLGVVTLGMVVAYGRLVASGPDRLCPAGPSAGGDGNPHGVPMSTARPERLGALLAFLLLGAWGLLVKESGVIALGCGCLGLALHSYRATGRVAPTLRPLLGGLLAVLAVAALLAWLCGGVDALVRVYRPLPGAPASVYLAGYDSGGPGYYVAGMLILQPVPLVLGVLGALLVALRVGLVVDFPGSDDGRSLLPALAWLVLVYGAVVMTQDPKNLRQLSPILVPLYLLAAVLVAAVLAEVRRRLPTTLGWGVTAAAGGGLAVAAFLDLDRFIGYFVIGGVPDLATPWLLQVAR